MRIRYVATTPIIYAPKTLSRSGLIFTTTDHRDVFGLASKNGPSIREYADSCSAYLLV